MVVFEETNEKNLNVLMPFSLGTQPLKIRSIWQYVGGFKHHLNGYFVAFWGFVPWSDFPSVQWGVNRIGIFKALMEQVLLNRDSYKWPDLEMVWEVESGFRLRLVNSPEGVWGGPVPSTCPGPGHMDMEPCYPCRQPTCYTLLALDLSNKCYPFLLLL